MKSSEKFESDNLKKTKIENFILLLSFTSLLEMMIHSFY